MTSDEKSIVLNRHQFEVIFQITYDLSNFGESQLLGRGCSKSDLNALLSVLRTVRDHATEESRIRIGVRDESLSSVSSTLSPTYADNSENETINGWIPIRIAQQWNSLTELVTSAHSERELFLRTGYEIDDIRRALARLGELADDES